MLKFKEMDDKKKRLIVIVSVLVVFIGVTLAYVVGQISDGAIGNANVTADTTDNLEFSVDKDVSLNPTQFNVTEGGGGLSDATLLANSTNKTATYDYYVYFNIKSNNYTYTTEDNKPEIVLTITDPEGNLVTKLANNNLEYVEAENADGTITKGFDITTASGLINIANLYEITSNSSTNATVQDWTFTVTFINLTTNQSANGGSTLDAEIILSKDEGYIFANYVINEVYTGVDGEKDLYYHDGNLETQEGVCTYGGERVYDAWSGYGSNSKSNCKNVFAATLNDGSKVYYDENVKLYSSVGNFGTRYNNNVFFQNVSWDSGLNRCVTTNTGEVVYTADQKLAEEQVCIGTAIWFDGHQTLMESVGSGEFEVTKTIPLVDANDKSYRYSGMYPNNYVCFGSNEETCPNDNLYRIIGVFDEDHDGIYNVKLIKADYTTNDMLGTDSRDYLGNNYTDQYTNFYAGYLDLNLIPTFNWNNDTSINEYGSNNWVTSELNTINLNTNFLNYLDYSWSSLIDDTTWFLGGFSINNYTNYNIKNFFDAERNNSGYSNNPTRYNAKIGLMYVSDYLFSIDPIYWQYAPEVSTFSGWLQMGLDEWLLSVTQDYDFYVLSTMYNGTLMPSTAVFNSQVDIYNTIRPVFYLKTNVTCISGSGTLNNPFRISA